MNRYSQIACESSGRHKEAEQLWKRAMLWLAFLAPFFFLSYGFSNWWSSQLTNVGSVVFSWEQNIPFIDWSIVPYWSIDVLYGLSLFICVSKMEIDTVGKRLLSAQIIAVLCFIAFPLSFVFARPETSGLPATMFAMLEGFDRPFNQAPSLHIALLVILWVTYAKHVPRRWNRLFHTWFALIGISVLTTYQHHFIDVPTGALLGWLCVWLWPDDGSFALAGLKPTKDRRRQLLALAYGVAGISTGAAALVLWGAYLWLLWPAISLIFVAVAYAGLGVATFQKSEHGHLSLAARWLLAPYIAGVWINSRLWTLKHPRPVQVMDNIWIGRFPGACDEAPSRFNSIIDLTAEMSAPHVAGNWQSIPNLDLATPQADALFQAANAIEHFKSSGNILVCCALGYSR
ncbi:MAG: phosphatase PAP2/dual specificity phosphatase family protein, partial [Hyphomicrobiales bacterium]|nr:phosphatase PAP2/dual specificity phosphatase family protein [Hyphomicrobiales bacterium]